MITKAAVLSDPQAEPPYAVSKPLVVEDLILQAPGDGQVLVRVGAAGLCHSDLSVIDGSRPRPLPMALGHEGAGIIEEVGRGVSGLRAGDHVVFCFVPACGRCVECMSGRPALCEPGALANGAGTLSDGTCRLSRPGGHLVLHHLGISCFASHAVVSEASVLPITDAIPLQVAALFGCALLTGVGAVVNTARVEPGTSVVIFGLGGVGMAAVMGAALAGAHPVIVVDPNRQKHEQACAVGASGGLVPSLTLTAQIRELTGGGAHYAFDAVGNTRVLADAFTVTRRGGTTVAIGLPHPVHKVELPAAVIAAEERRILGSYLGSSVPVRDVPRLIGLHEAGKLPVERLLSRTVGLNEINESFDRLAEGSLLRQVVDLDPDI
ncbi:MAG: zinc-binding dehydrogenase [Sciscionella sp.]